MSTDLASTLNAKIDQHVDGQRTGAVESHDLNSLCKRLLAPRDVVVKLLSAGVLRSEGPVHGRDDTGLMAFTSDSLNEVRRAVLYAIVEKVVEDSDGIEGVDIAAGAALKEHVASFNNQENEFAAFPKGLVQLAAYPYSQDDEQPGALQQAATTAGKVAAVGALGYGAAALLRGRKLAPTGSIIDKLKAGALANNATGRLVAGRLGAGAAKVANVLKGLA